MWCFSRSSVCWSPQDLPSWSERYQETEDSGQFLTATCQNDVAAEVQDALQRLQTRWQQFFKAGARN